MESKQRQYAALVAKRKECRMCDNLENPALPPLCHFDSDHIGPWSRLHGDLDAQLMVVGQDWGDVNYDIKYLGCDDPGNATMRNLEKLLAHIGLTVSVTSYAAGNRNVSLTNAILCLKRGGLQAAIDPKWVDNCGSQFLRQQIELVRPRVVVGLGAFAFKAVLQVAVQGMRVSVGSRRVGNPADYGSALRMIWSRMPLRSGSGDETFFRNVSRIASKQLWPTAVQRATSSITDCSRNSVSCLPIL